MSSATTPAPEQHVRPGTLGLTPLDKLPVIDELDLLRAAVTMAKRRVSAALWNGPPLSQEFRDAIAAKRAAREALAAALELEGEPRPGTTLIVWVDSDPSLVLTENVEEYLSARGKCWDYSSQDQNAIIDDEGCTIAELEGY